MSSSNINDRTSKRLRSLDALRGFDMLWIIGLDILIRLISSITDSSLLGWLAEQTHHAQWEGVRFYDLIFPIFVFISGVAIPYSMRVKLNKGITRTALSIHTVKRVIILVLLGFIYNGVLNFQWDNLRCASVLGTIGIAYGIAAFLFLFTKTFRARLLCALAILLSVAALQLLIPVPDHGCGVLTQQGIFNAWFDKKFLPGRLYGGSFDPEGWICVFSASFLALLGCLVGELIYKRNSPQLSSIIQISGAGIAFILLGWFCWELGYPPIKAAWTSSFNLIAGGVALLLFAIFHLTIDFKNTPNWSLPFQIVGMNPLTIYLLYRIISFKDISHFFFSGIASLCGRWELSVIATGTIIVQFLILTLCYRKRIFLRI